MTPLLEWVEERAKAYNAQVKALGATLMTVMGK